MAELSQSKGKAIAIVENSNVKSENGTIIYLYHTDHKCCLDCSPKCSSKKKCCEGCAKITYHGKLHNGSSDEVDVDRLKKLMMVFKNKNINFTEDELDEILENESNVGAGLKGSNIQKDKIVLRSGNFQICPSNIYGVPNRIYYAGMPGSGKTFALAEYVVLFKKMKPNYRIYLLSQKPNDKLLDKLIHKRIPLDSLPDANFEAEDFKESLLIADDVDTISDKTVEKATFDLIDKCLEVGRSLDTFMCLTMHLPANNKQTRRILNSSTHYVYFKNSSNHGNDYVLENYYGFSKDEIKKLKKINSRSITIIRDVPQLVMANDLLCFQSKLTE
jgi:hypothetical protein